MKRLGQVTLIRKPNLGSDFGESTMAAQHQVTGVLHSDAGDDYRFYATVLFVKTYLLN
jgi:hypothetical protein